LWNPQTRADWFIPYILTDRSAGSERTIVWINTDSGYFCRTTPFFRFFAVICNCRRGYRMRIAPASENASQLFPDSCAPSPESIQIRCLFVYSQKPTPTENGYPKNENSPYNRFVYSVVRTGRSSPYPSPGAVRRAVPFC